MPKFTAEDIYKLLGAIIVALSTYYATLNAVETEAAILKEREGNHYAEVSRRLDTIEQRQFEILNALRGLR